VQAYSHRGYMVGFKSNEFGVKMHYDVQYAVQGNSLVELVDAVDAKWN